ncbi:MAG: hypothetical protein GYA21_11295 [Myxococcales bacterium]|nr:hypothetical protein [Myxococcales bacterium]
MKKRFLAICSILFSTSLAWAGWPGNVTEVKAEKGKSVTVEGKLETGSPMTDLSWASSSQVACFPATQNEKFQGNHVLYSTSLPPKSVMVITLVPKDTNANMSLYAYQIGTTNFDLPPQLGRCTSCEADHKWDRPKKGKTQDHTRSVTLNATTNPYNVVIGVAGPKNVTAGEFTLKVEIK